MINLFNLMTNVMFVYTEIIDFCLALIMLSTLFLCFLALTKNVI